MLLKDNLDNIIIALTSHNYKESKIMIYAFLDINVLMESFNRLL